MAQKISIDVSLDDIKAMIQQRLAVSPALPSLPGASSAVNQLYRVSQDRLGTPPGDILAQRHLDFRQAQAERRVEREIKASQETPFDHAVRGLQIGAGLAKGGGAAGMLGSIGQFAELLAVANPEIVIAVAAVTGLAVAANEAAKTLTMLAQGALATGSTPGTFAFGRAISGAAGLSPDSFQGTAESLRQRIATDPLGMSAAGRFGVHALRPGFGPMPDMGAMFSQLFQGMRGMNRAQMGQFVERLPEMKPFMAIAMHGSNEQIQRAQALAAEVGKLATPEAIRSAIDLSLAQGELALQWDKLKITIGAELIPLLVELVKGFSDFLNKAIPVAKLFYDLQSGQWDKVSEDFKKTQAAFGGKPASEADEQKKTQKEHAEAMKEHARELRMNRVGTFGGGERAHGAIPAGLRGEALENAIRAQATRLGAF